LKVIFYTV